MMRSKTRRLPERTCIACRQIKEKKSLIRVVRTENGLAQVDISGKQPGRGAYLCPSRACWELMLRKDRLGYALRAKLSAENRQTLLQYIHDLPEED